MPRIKIIIKGRDEAQQGSASLSSLGFALSLAWLFSTTFGGLSFNPGSSIPRFTELTGLSIPLTLVVTLLAQGISLLILGPAVRNKVQIVCGKSPSARPSAL